MTPHTAESVLSGMMLPCLGNIVSLAKVCVCVCVCRPGPFYYTKNPCTGSTRINQTWILSPTVCSTGEYIVSDANTTNAIRCARCRTSCSSGHFLQGSCAGNTYRDTTICSECSSCSQGQYRDLLHLCNGSTSVDTVQCRPCRTQCAHGEYIFGICSGSQGFDETLCTACKDCARYAYMSSFFGLLFSVYPFSY